MIVRISGHPKLSYFPKTASTALSNGSAVKLTSGKLVVATANEVAGIVLRDVVSTDADYAGTTMLPVDVPQQDDVFEIDIASGTSHGFAATDVGTKFDLDATGLLLNTDGTTNKTALVVGFVSSTKALVKIVGSNVNDTN